MYIYVCVCVFLKRDNLTLWTSENDNEAPYEETETAE